MNKEISIYGGEDLNSREALAENLKSPDLSKICVDPHAKSRIQQQLNQNKALNVCDGFRIPDQAIYLQLSESEEPENGGINFLDFRANLLSSCFWFGKKENAEEFVENTLRTAVEMDIRDRSKDPQEEPEALLCLWDSGNGEALVGMLGFGDWAINFEDNELISNGVDQLEMYQAGYSTNDNGPYNIFDNLDEGDIGPERVAKWFELVQEAWANPGQTDEGITATEDQANHFKQSHPEAWGIWAEGQQKNIAKVLLNPRRR